VVALVTALVLAMAMALVLALLVVLIGALLAALILALLAALLAASLRAAASLTEYSTLGIFAPLLLPVELSLRGGLGDALLRTRRFYADRAAGREQAGCASAATRARVRVRMRMRGAMARPPSSPALAGRRQGRRQRQAADLASARREHDCGGGPDAAALTHRGCGLSIHGVAAAGSVGISVFLEKVNYGK